MTKAKSIACIYFLGFLMAVVNVSRFFLDINMYILFWLFSTCTWVPAFTLLILSDNPYELLAKNMEELKDLIIGFLLTVLFVQIFLLPLAALTSSLDFFWCFVMGSIGSTLMLTAMLSEVIFVRKRGLNYVIPFTLALPWLINQNPSIYTFFSNFPWLFDLIYLMSGCGIFNLLQIWLGIQVVAELTNTSLLGVALLIAGWKVAARIFKWYYAPEKVKTRACARVISEIRAGKVRSFRDLFSSESIRTIRKLALNNGLPTDLYIIYAIEKTLAETPIVKRAKAEGLIALKDERHSDKNLLEFCVREGLLSGYLSRNGMVYISDTKLKEFSENIRKAGNISIKELVATYPMYVSLFRSETQGDEEAMKTLLSLCVKKGLLEGHFSRDGSTFMTKTWIKKQILKRICSNT